MSQPTNTPTLTALQGLNQPLFIFDEAEEVTAVQIDIRTWAALRQLVMALLPEPADSGEDEISRAKFEALRESRTNGAGEVGHADN
jgi:hypothetical protein